MQVKYVCWNYGKVRGETLHLVRFESGEGKLITDAEAVRWNLAKWK